MLPGSLPGFASPDFPNSPGHLASPCHARATTLSQSRALAARIGIPPAAQTRLRESPQENPAMNSKALLLAAALAAFPLAPAGAETFKFVAIGDMPYGNPERTFPLFRSLIGAI